MHHIRTKCFTCLPNVSYSNVPVSSRFQAPPPPIKKPLTSNVAARSVDVSWEPPMDYWLALAITGYEASLTSDSLAGGDA